MNKWVKKSINLANSPGYLDNLMEVYPIGQAMLRKITPKEEKIIKKTFVQKNKKKLLSVLLDLERFPIDDPYIGFLRKHKGALDENPKTVRRIGEKLLDMKLDGILKGAKRPKSPSRQLGQMFRNWLPKLGYPILPREDFLKYRGVAILEGGDAALKKFAKEELSYRGQKGLDIVFRTKRRFIIGEAKFITASGGSQGKGFRETIALIKSKQRQALRIAILDGVVWLASQKTKKKKISLYESVSRLNENQIALSTLLLKEFIKEQTQ